MSISQADSDAKFPNQSTGLPPSPTRENPGQVFPKSDPNAGPARHPTSTAVNSLGNPYLMANALKTLDDSLGDVISLLEREGVSVGSSIATEGLVRKFRSWRNELEEMRIGDNIPTGTTAPPAAGTQRGDGIFTE